MNNYSNNFSITKQRRKTKKTLIAAVTIVVVALLVVAFVGIVAGTDTQRSRNIGSAIAENTTLKQLVEEQQVEIDELTAKVQELESKLPEEEVIPYEPQEGEMEEEYEQEGEMSESAGEYPASPREELR